MKYIESYTDFTYTSIIEKESLPILGTISDLYDYLEKDDDLKVIELIDDGSTSYIDDDFFEEIKNLYIEYDMDRRDEILLQKLDSIIRDKTLIKKGKLFASKMKRLGSDTYRRNIWNEYVKYVMDKGILDLYNIGVQLPAWGFLSKTKYSRNQWVVHFTDYKDDIIKSHNKFMGYTDIKNVAMTSHFDKSDYRMNNGFVYGYDIEYLLNDDDDEEKWEKYGKDPILVYVKQCIKAYHDYDLEYQTIFKPNDITQLYYVVEEDQNNIDTISFLNKKLKKVYSSESDMKIAIQDFIDHNHNMEK